MTAATTTSITRRLHYAWIILVMGVVVGFIVVAMLMAILSVTDLPL